ncbi:hypothetical protein [Pelagimonas varians]|uniref:hypothetical protein n=1 Tax=Pelagimonas varians TaxID=696760 RepID=UPI00147427E5|nr:hypothetical protein [Pelagimonas varians]
MSKNLQEPLATSQKATQRFDMLIPPSAKRLPRQASYLRKAALGGLCSIEGLATCG